MPDHTRSRRLRRETTPAERRLWLHLRDRRLGGYKFRRQHWVGPSILDFYCAEQRLAVEVDGGGHNGPRAGSLDAARTVALEQAGVRVLRFWNDTVMRELPAVLDAILRELRA